MQIPNTIPDFSKLIIGLIFIVCGAILPDLVAALFETEALIVSVFVCISVGLSTAFMSLAIAPLPVKSTIFLVVTRRRENWLK